MDGRGRRIVDYPRYAYRGAMLDVSRHFFGVDVVKRYLDEISQYKINTLHLPHLSDDQGWRIVVDARPPIGDRRRGAPRSAAARAATTPRRQILRHRRLRGDALHHDRARDRHARARQRQRSPSYAELNCNGTAPPLYTRDRRRVQLAVREQGRHLHLRAAGAERGWRPSTPGPYLHIGGDEAQSTSVADYRHVHESPSKTVRRRRPAKTVLGWHQIAAGRTTPRTGSRKYWVHVHFGCGPQRGREQGRQDPAVPGEQDIPRHEVTTTRPRSASHGPALIEVQTAYGWDPGAYLSGVPAGSGDSRRRGSTVDGDDHEAGPTSSSWRSRGCPPSRSCWHGRPQSAPQLGRLQGAAGCTGSTVDGTGHQLLPLDAGPVRDTLPSASPIGFGFAVGTHRGHRRRRRPSRPPLRPVPLPTAGLRPARRRRGPAVRCFELSRHRFVRVRRRSPGSVTRGDTAQCQQTGNRPVEPDVSARRLCAGQLRVSIGATGTGVNAST